MTARPRDRWVAPLVGAVAIAIVAARVGAKPPPETAPAAADVVPSELRFTTDRSALYDVGWQTSSTLATPATGPASATVDFDGRVEIFDAGREGERRLVGLRVASSRRAQATALGKDLFASDDDQRRQLEGKVVVLALDASGSVEHVYVPGDATDLAKNLLQPLALHFAVTLPPPDAGAAIATEQGDFGPIVWSTTRHEGGLRRASRESGSVAESEVTFVSGVPSRIATTVTVAPRAGEHGTTTARATFTASRVGDGEPGARRVDLAAFDRHAPDERPTAIDERAANLALANGMTPDDVASMVVAYGGGRRPPKGDVTRATALLLATPELGDALGKLFANDAIGEHGRELVIDLLASAGDARSQAHMRALLGSSRIQKERDELERLVQRFALVAAPVAESIAFVHDEWVKARRAGERRMRQATTYTLGSMAGHAHAMRQDDLAVPVLNELLAVLRKTKDEDEERGLVAALGNAGMRDALPPILARAAATDERTRAQVATALRKFDSADARTKLIDLLGDADGQVALGAVRSLDVQRLGRPELELLAERVEAQRVHVDVDATLVGVVATHVVDAALARRTLSALRARAEENPERLRAIEQAMAALAKPAP